MKKRDTIREYLIKHHPDIYSEILEDTKKAAKENFDSDADIKLVSVPFFLPITVDDYLPTMSYVIYNRDLQEVDTKGNAK